MLGSPTAPPGWPGREVKAKGAEQTQSQGLLSQGHEEGPCCQLEAICTLHQAKILGFAPKAIGFAPKAMGFAPRIVGFSTQSLGFAPKAWGSAQAKGAKPSTRSRREDAVEAKAG